LPVGWAVQVFAQFPGVPTDWYVVPTLVAEVRFDEWTQEGVLNLPVVVGLSGDKRPEECIRIPPSSERPIS